MKTTLAIQNLKCGGCAATISKNLATIPTLTNIEIDVIEKKVTFEYESALQLEQVRAKLIALGYPEEGESNTIGAKAKSFVSCAVGKMSS